MGAAFSSSIMGIVGRLGWRLRQLKRLKALPILRWRARRRKQTRAAFEQLAQAAGTTGNAYDRDAARHRAAKISDLNLQLAANKANLFNRKQRRTAGTPVWRLPATVRRKWDQHNSGV